MTSELTNHICHRIIVTGLIGILKAWRFQKYRFCFCKFTFIVSFLLLVHRFKGVICSPLLCAALQVTKRHGDMFQSYYRAPLGTRLSAHYQMFFSRKGGRVCMWISLFASKIRILKFLCQLMRPKNYWQQFSRAFLGQKSLTTVYIIIRLIISHWWQGQ